MERYDIDNIEMILSRDFGTLFSPESRVLKEGKLIYQGIFREEKRSINTLIERFNDLGYNVEVMGRGPEITLIFTLKMHEAESQRPKEEQFPAIHILLFLVTIFSTFAAGAVMFNINILKEPAKIWMGYPFAVPLIFILFAHEMGHYLMSRRYRVDATLPYFIPFPNIIGTMGAVIKMKSPIPDRNALIDIGMAGPLAGIIVSVPVIIIGLMLSKTAIQISDKMTGGIMLGDSLLFTFFTWLLYGHIPENIQLVLHPTAFAGWVGLLVTFMNLFPASQLDGGHISYAIFGPLHKSIGKFVCIIFAIMGIFYWPWFIWLALILFIGLKHPPPIDDTTPINRKRMILGCICIAIFILTFVPKPFYGPDLPVDLISLYRAFR